MQKEKTLHSEHRALFLFFWWGMAHTSAIGTSLAFTSQKCTAGFVYAGFLSVDSFTPPLQQPCEVAARRGKRKFREMKRLIHGFPATQ